MSKENKHIEIHHHNANDFVDWCSIVVKTLTDQFDNNIARLGDKSKYKNYIDNLSDLTERLLVLKESEVLNPNRHYLEVSSSKTLKAVALKLHHLDYIVNRYINKYFNVIAMEE